MDEIEQEVLFRLSNLTKQELEYYNSMEWAEREAKASMEIENDE